MEQKNHAEESEDKILVHVLGTTSYSSKIPFFPSFILEYGGKYAIVDPTTKLQAALWQLERVSGKKITVAEIDTAILSHIHSDHAAGMIDLSIAKLYVERRKGEDRCRFVGVPEVLKVCEDKVITGTLEYTFNQEMQEVQNDVHNIFRQVPLEPDKPCEVDKIDEENVLIVTARQGQHAVRGGSYGFIFTYRGVSVGYSGDTALGKDGRGLLSFIEDSDMYIHEAGGVCVAGHVPMKTLEELVDTERKDRLKVIHYNDHQISRKRLPLLMPWVSYEVSKKGIRSLPITQEGAKELEKYGFDISGIEIEQPK